MLKHIRTIVVVVAAVIMLAGITAAVTTSHSDDLAGCKARVYGLCIVEQDDPAVCGHMSRRYCHMSPGDDDLAGCGISDPRIDGDICAPDLYL